MLQDYKISGILQTIPEARQRNVGQLFVQDSVTTAQCVYLIMRQLPIKICNLRKEAVENVVVQLYNYYISQNDQSGKDLHIIFE
jgi:hypothetical protein